MTDLKIDYSQLPYGRNGAKPGQNRMNWRCELLLTRNAECIKDKVVLDLACNNGRLAYPCLQLGATKVVGVEARQELIDTGMEYLANTPFESRMRFVNADLFEFLDSTTEGEFDTILCCGFLYHTVRQVEFFRQVGRIRPRNIIIDTSVAKNYLWYGLKHFMKKPPALFMAIDNPDKTSDTTDVDGMVFFPTTSLLEKAFEVINYEWRRIEYKGEVDDWAGLKVYKKGLRASYIAHRRD